jgi:triosephosphate isomerase (TIM)
MSHGMDSEHPFPKAAPTDGSGLDRTAGGARRRIVAGNWKMHFVVAAATEYCRELRRGLAEHQARPGHTADGPEVLLFPSFPLLPAVARELAGGDVALGAQDVHPAERGAHTGDVSAPQLVDAGCRWVLCGHSERRRDHGESDELIGLKVAAATRHGLTPLLCVGETRAQREAGETFAVLARQLRGGLASHPGPPVPLVVAYEPVWAIGTGLTASPETAQEAHRFLRAEIGGVAGAGGAAATLLYGGSVTPANTAGLIAQPDVDGFLVGGASLDPLQFLAIIAGSAG